MEIIDDQLFVLYALHGSSEYCFLGIFLMHFHERALEISN